MKEVMLAAFPANAVTGNYKCIFLAHKDLAGLIIGKGGMRIEGLKRNYNVQVTLSPPANSGQVDEEIMMTGENLIKYLCVLVDSGQVDEEPL
jgi:hypothetical protein